jgi:SAM-dependent methyltransferase
MIQFWDDRYAREEYVYGKQPNRYLEQQLSLLPPAKILFPAEGEGRNAVYAACRGWDVYAFDQSREGKRKALDLAAANNVKIDYRTGEFMEMEYTPGQFDAIGLVYVHFPPEKKRIYHNRLADYLKPGGVMIIESFSKQHTDYQLNNPNIGGPRDLELLDSAEELLSFYKGFDILEMMETETELDEGPFHQGKAHVVRFTGRKKPDQPK